MVLLSINEEEKHFYLSVLSVKCPANLSDYTEFFIINLFKYTVNNKIGFWYTKKSHCTSSIERLFWYDSCYRWIWKENQIQDITDVTNHTILANFHLEVYSVLLLYSLHNENIWPRFTPEQYYMSESTSDGKTNCWIYYKFY